MRKLQCLGGALCALAICTNGWSAEVETALTKTRPEMKKTIEGLKLREARIPLPPLTAEEIASGRRSVNNGRLRSIYLPESWQSSNNSGRNQGRTGQGQAAQGQPAQGQTAQGQTAQVQPAQTDRQRLEQMQQAPDYGFKTRLFWIVSRTNDCQYCLGHQELKLKRVGMTDDQIAALDCKWSAFPEEEQAWMKVTRKITLTPHLVTDEDLAPLKKHYSDTQIVDILQTVCGNNSTNRWTASTGIPQDRSFGGDEPSQLDTPTSAEFSTVETKVAPLDYKPRAPWESRAEAEAAMTACQSRTSLVKLPSMQAARQALGG